MQNIGRNLSKRLDVNGMIRIRESSARLSELILSRLQLAF